MGERIFVWFEEMNQWFIGSVVHWVSGSVGEPIFVWFEEVNDWFIGSVAY